MASGNGYCLISVLSGPLLSLAVALGATLMYAGLRPSDRVLAGLRTGLGGKAGKRGRIFRVVRRDLGKIPR
jgi:hypothetical protein